MARPRAPRTAGIAGAMARILGLGASVVLLANLIYESVGWGKTLGLSVSVAVIALVVDGSEVTGLLDSTRTIPRVPQICLICEDLLVLCLAIPSIFVIIISNYNVPAGEILPWDSTDTLSIAVTIAICVLRFIFLIWGCVECCYAIRHPRRPENLLTPVHSTGELSDVPSSRR